MSTRLEKVEALLERLELRAGLRVDFEVLRQNDDGSFPPATDPNALIVERRSFKASQLDEITREHARIESEIAALKAKQQSLRARTDSQSAGFISTTNDLRLDEAMALQSRLESD